MHEFGSQLCLLISRDSKHISQVCCRWSLGFQDWWLRWLQESGVQGVRKDCKKKSSEKDDGQPDGGILGGGGGLLSPGTCLVLPA